MKMKIATFVNVCIKRFAYVSMKNMGTHTSWKKVLCCGDDKGVALQLLH